MDKQELFKSLLAEEDVEVPGRGTVRVRALSRAQALHLRGTEMSHSKLERKLLSWAMVNPPLTESEVEQWQDASVAGEIETVSEAIIRLSGMEVSSGKDAWKSAGE